jgi:hypothetical protein
MSKPNPCLHRGRQCNCITRNAVFLIGFPCWVGRLNYFCYQIGNQMVIISEAIDAAVGRIIFLWVMQYAKISAIGALRAHIIENFSYVQNSDFRLTSQCQLLAEDPANFSDLL